MESDKSKKRALANSQDNYSPNLKKQVLENKATPSATKGDKLQALSLLTMATDLHRKSKEEEDAGMKPGEQGMKEETTLVSCPVCKKSCHGIKELMDHHTEAHSADSTTCSSPNPFDAHTGDSRKGDSDKDSVDDGSSTGTGSKRGGKRSTANFECDLCQKGFASRQGLQNHVLTVHLKKRTFQCKECNKKFSANGSLKRHIDTVHLGQRKYECNICHKSFALKHHLKNHVVTVHQQKNPNIDAIEAMRVSNSSPQESDFSSLLKNDSGTSQPATSSNLGFLPMGTQQQGLQGLQGLQGQGMQGLLDSSTRDIALRALLAQQGLSSQHLMANGLVNSSTSLPTGGGAAASFLQGLGRIVQQPGAQSTPVSILPEVEKTSLQQQQQALLLATLMGNRDALGMSLLKPELGRSSSAPGPSTSSQLNLGLLEQLFLQKRLIEEQQRIGGQQKQLDQSRGTTNNRVKGSDVPIVPFPSLLFAKRQLNEKSSPSSDGSESPNSFSTVM